MALLAARRAGSIVAATAVAVAAAAAAPARAAVTAAVAPAVAPPGANLLLNTGAEAGAASQQGWDSVTIPGWQVRQGLPTVVRYGTPGFPARAATPGQCCQLFGGGAGGTAEIGQQIALETAAGHAAAASTRFTLGGWLGGTATSRAELVAAFRSGTGEILGTRRTGPAGGSGTAGRQLLAWRQVSGVLPAGTRSVTVELHLTTSLTDDDGPNAPVTGYDRAVADGLRFTVTAAVRRPALVPPAAHVPRFAHVFLFYFENQDYGQVIGNTAGAPYLNSLLPRSSLLADFFAEEHPSDGNYLALAGGSTFGIPLDDPEEENPRYTIKARSIAGLISSAHESWKAYLQSASGPCDDTVHENYWNDDQPMMYFADVRERPSYCAAHVVPLQSLRGDLRQARSTPAFAWIAPDDCSDMEGCGIRAGDSFLRAQLGLILRSPAWTRQRSLAIITFDEDAYDHERPAQRVATIVLGSAGVRQGYVSGARYTHYSLLRTIEAALGLGTLTRNDRYAPAFNDVFTSNPAPPPLASTFILNGSPSAALAPHAPAVVPAARPAPHEPATPRAGSAGTPAPTAFVVNAGSGTVTPIDLATRTAGRPIRTGADPQAIAITPDGRTAYVANEGSGTVTPIATASRTAGPPVKVGAGPDAIAVTPDGRTAYVANEGSGTVTPIAVATGRAGAPIRVGAFPRAVAATPDGATVYVLNWGSGSVTPIATATNRARPAIRVGAFPVAIAITPDGRAAYVASYGSGTVTPIAVATGRAGAAIPAGQAPDAIAVSPDGRTVYVTDGDSDAVTPIATATDRPGRPVAVGYAPEAVAFTRAGTAYVVNTISGSLTPIAAATGRAGHPISVGAFDYPVGVAYGSQGTTGLVLDTYAGQVTPLDAATGRVYPAITVGSYPAAAAITP